MVTGLSGGGTAAFFYRVQFLGVGLGGTATSWVVHHHPMSGARGSMDNSN